MKSNTWVTRFDIHGVRVDVEVDNLEVHGWFDEYLSAFAVTGDSPAKIKFTFSVNPDKSLSVPEEAQWFMHYYGLAGLTMERFYYFRARGAVIRFDPDNSLAVASLTREMLKDRRYLTHVFLSVALFEALRYHGLYYVHGAALESPDGEGILIPANGSSGKSTISVSLLHLGYKYLSDDAVFVYMKEDQAALVPFIREFHAPLRLMDIFRELEFLKNEPEYFFGNEKRALHADRVYPGRLLKAMGSPKVVLFPEIVEEEKSAVNPLKPQEALSRMIPNSPLVMFSLSVARPHMEALKKIVLSANCFSLRSGKDIYYDPIGALPGILNRIGLSSRSD